VKKYEIPLIGTTSEIGQVRVDMYIAFELNRFYIMTEMENYAVLHKFMSDFAVDGHPVHGFDSIY